MHAYVDARPYNTVGGSAGVSENVNERYIW